MVKKGFNRISSYPINSPHMFFIYFVQSYILYLTCRVVVHCARTGTYTILPPLYIHCCLQCKHLGLAMRNLVPQSSSTNASTIGNQKRVSKEQWLSAAPSDFNPLTILTWAYQRVLWHDDLYGEEKPRGQRWWGNSAASKPSWPGEMITAGDRAKVIKFYELDMVSHMCPGSKDYMVVRDEEGFRMKAKKGLFWEICNRFYSFIKGIQTI